MKDTRLSRLEAAAQALAFPLNEPIRIGGNYVPALRHGNEVHVSGQIPRIGTTVVCTGKAGSEVSLDEARHGARIATLRALCLLREAAGTLDAIERIVRITVYVQSAGDFTLQSEVADAASDLLVEILGEAGRHTRTSVGVWQLPKNATVELDLLAALRPA